MVLTLMAVLAGIGGLAIASLKRPPVDTWKERIAEARARAIDSGVAVVALDSVHTAVRLMPDGQGIGPGIDQLTGAVVHAEQ